MPGIETKSFLSTLEPLALREGDSFELCGRCCLPSFLAPLVPALPPSQAPLAAHVSACSPTRLCSSLRLWFLLPNGPFQCDTLSVFSGVCLLPRIPFLFPSLYGSPMWFFSQRPASGGVSLPSLRLFLVSPKITIKALLVVRVLLLITTGRKQPKKEQ